MEARIVTPSALPRPVAPFVLPYDGIAPQFETEPQSCGVASSVLGKVNIGARYALAYHSVIRADGHFVRIGADFYLGEFSTVHIAHEAYPTIIGDYVTVGRNAVIHACTVADRCIVEDDVVILDGSVIEPEVLIETGSTVYPRSKLKAGYLYSGSPAKPIRCLTSSERGNRESRMRASIASSVFPIKYNALGQEFTDDVFVAQTARLSGQITLERCSSVFFSCQLDAGKASINIGELANIQDNTRIQCDTGQVTIGHNTTIGHNVLIKSSHIGRRTLVGIGSTVSAGTTIDDDVMLAAGSITNAGQHLERGWIWGGRPARPISRVDDSKRSMMAHTIDHYYAYGQSYRRSQQRLPRQGE